MINSTQITIRQIESPEEFRQCECLQKEVWGSDDLAVVPAHQLISVIKNGGVVLGAFNLKEELVGFCYGFIGRREGKVTLHSHMLGVLKAYRGHGIGYRLKLQQRKWALEHSLDLITWTFDPLESANAYLNLHKLGGICRMYYVDFYGPLSDELNQNLATDRLLVEWYLNSECVQHRGSQSQRRFNISDFPIITSVEKGSSGYLRLIEYNLERRESQLLLQIPHNFQELKKIVGKLASEWRHKTRSIFTHYFSRGYVATDFLIQSAADEPHCFYLLEKAA